MKVLHDLDTGAHDGLVFFITHTAEPVDALDAEPAQRVGHHALEARVADAWYGRKCVERTVWKKAFLVGTL